MRRTKITCCVILKSPDYSVVRTNVNEAVEQTGQERNGPFCRDVPCFSTECVHVSDELVHCSFNLPTLSPFPQFSYIAVSGLSPPPPPPPPPVETAPPPPPPPPHYKFLDPGLLSLRGLSGYVVKHSQGCYIGSREWLVVIT